MNYFDFQGEGGTRSRARLGHCFKKRFCSYSYSIYGTIELHTLKIVVLHGTRHDTLRLSFVPSEALSVCVCAGSYSQNLYGKDWEIPFPSPRQKKERSQLRLGIVIAMNMLPEKDKFKQTTAINFISVVAPKLPSVSYTHLTLPTIYSV